MVVYNMGVYNLFIFCWIYTILVFALAPSNSVIKRV